MTALDAAPGDPAPGDRPGEDETRRPRSRLRWWRESMRSPRPRLARGDLMGAPVVVVAPARASDARAAEPRPRS